jgi:hypothetical protein
MATLSRDTHPEAERRLVDGFRRMSGAERLARVSALRDATLGLARVRIREKYGDLPEREVRLRLASLWLDRDTMRRAFGWDPRERGY